MRGISVKYIILCAVFVFFFFFGALCLMYQKWLLQNTLEQLESPFFLDYPVNFTHMSQYNIDPRFMYPSVF